VISLNRRESALECSVCKEQEGVTDTQMKHEQEIRVMTARMQEDHSTCEEYADNPARAQAERQYTVRMRALMRGQRW
jgi:hypothetical protein